MVLSLIDAPSVCEARRWRSVCARHGHPIRYKKIEYFWRVKGRFPTTAASAYNIAQTRKILKRKWIGRFPNYFDLGRYSLIAYEEIVIFTNFSCSAGFCGSRLSGTVRLRNNCRTPK